MPVTTLPLGAAVMDRLSKGGVVVLATPHGPIALDPPGGGQGGYCNLPVLGLEEGDLGALRGGGAVVLHGVCVRGPLVDFVLVAREGAALVCGARDLPGDLLWAAREAAGLSRSELAGEVLRLRAELAGAAPPRPPEQPRNGPMDTHTAAAGPAHMTVHPLDPKPRGLALADVDWSRAEIAPDGPDRPCRYHKLTVPMAGGGRWRVAAGTLDGCRAFLAGCRVAAGRADVGFPPADGAAVFLTAKQVAYLQEDAFVVARRGGRMVMVGVDITAGGVGGGPGDLVVSLSPGDVGDLWSGVPVVSRERPGCLAGVPVRLASPTWAPT